MNTALVLLEIQNDYFPNGRTPLEKSIEASGKAQLILNIYREKKLPVIHVQHISTHPNATYLLPCTKGAEFHSNVQPIKNEIIIKKHYANSFKDTQLSNYLIKNQINQLLLCGMMTHLTVDSTVRAAHDLGFSCTVIHDACATKQLEFQHTTIPMQSVHYAFLASLYPSYANILSTEEYMQRIGARITSEEHA